MWPGTSKPSVRPRNRLWSTIMMAPAGRPPPTAAGGTSRLPPTPASLPFATPPPNKLWPRSGWGWGWVAVEVARAAGPGFGGTLLLWRPRQPRPAGCASSPSPSSSSCPAPLPVLGPPSTPLWCAVATTSVAAKGMGGAESLHAAESSGCLIAAKPPLLPGLKYGSPDALSWGWVGVAITLPPPTTRQVSRPLQITMIAPPHFIDTSA